MKTLTGLAAIAALAAGISVAGAQSGMSNSSGSQRQAIGNSPFCVSTSASGSLNCKYTSLAECEKDAKPQNQTCTPNPNKGTTGAK